MPDAAGPPALQARGIVKRYGAVQALDNVGIEVSSGEVLGLVGDNGAGKSTLLKILAGAVTPNEGRILLDGKETVFRNPQEARSCGIESVYQDLALAPDLTVWENMFLGREKLVDGIGRLFGVLDKKAMARRSTEELGRTNIRIGSPHSLCGSMSGGQRQAVAVARAVAWGSKVLLLDEPTAALGVEQQAKVCDLVRTVRDQGVAVVMVSHNLPQVHALCNRIAVLFRGQVVQTLSARTATVEETVRWITGVGALPATG